jgi:putative endonuclease
MKRRETGAIGESVACEFLGCNGYDIIHRNYRCPEGEIDIVARQAGTLVFVEVRTKRSRAFGAPEESITFEKQARLRHLAEKYVQEHSDLPVVWRIDVVAVELKNDGKVSRIEIIENAVEEA